MPWPVVLAAVVLIGLTVALIALVAPFGEGSGAGPSIAIDGREQTVFDWAREGCAEDDIPDAPARAFRDFRGRVHLIASHFTTRQAQGPDLDRVRHRCDVSFRSHEDPAPAAYDDREWLIAPYTLDGRSVFALVHDEYQGYNHPGRCSSGSSAKCWYNAITLASSRDGGNSFDHAQPPGQLVAAVPYRYTPNADPFGIFSPSNIVRRRDDGYFYSLVHVRPYRDQPGGACLIRTRDLADARSWRAWGGDSFTVAFANPYLDPDEGSKRNICRPVAAGRIGGMTQSLTWSTYLERFVLVGMSADFDRSERRNVAGLYYSFSDDLINWTGRRLLAEVELISTFRCGDRDPVMYPSLLDPASGSRNFETIGRRPYLYVTRFHNDRCQTTLDRDLVRVPVVFSR